MLQHTGIIYVTTLLNILPKFSGSKRNENCHQNTEYTEKYEKNTEMSVIDKENR